MQTAEDFGVQGKRPSHPKLLDWLAVELMNSGWDVKRLIRQIVTSHTYRQTSEIDKQQQEIDPANRFLTRFPRLRLRAESIRDQALAASGLLTERLGGPSVRPYQPDGLWNEIASYKDYEQSQGADLYRRGFYTYWKRTVGPPSLLIFDASSRETCVVQVPKTNTPLQSLALMNDVTFVEACRVLAQKMMNRHRKVDARLDELFLRLLARGPSEAELHILRSSYQAHLQNFKRDTSPKEISAGDYPVDNSLPADQLFALTMVASTIMNLDEFVTKE